MKLLFSIKRTSIILFLMATFFIANHAQAITFVVSNNNDSGLGSLRQAIINANAVAAGPNVLIDLSNITGVIALNTTLPNITRSMSLTGPVSTNVEADLLIIQRSGTAGNINFINVTAGATVTIQYLTFRNGRSTSSGGAITNLGTMNIYFCRFVNNAAPSGSGRAGAIISSGNSTLNIHNCQFEGNSATSWAGAIEVYQSTGRIFSSTFLNNSSGNFGGGVANSDGTLEMTNCTFVGNTSSNQGGGLIGNDFGSTAFVANTTLTHCTFVNNTATNISGGVHNAGSASILRLNYCLIVNNTAASDPNVGLSTATAITSTTGRNVFGAQNTTFLTGTTTGNIYSATAAATFVAPANFNGAFTRNIALAAASPALNMAVGSALARDQRGLVRGGVLDAGAFEVGATTPAGTATPMSVTLSANSICEGVAGTINLTLNNPFSASAIYEWVITNGTAYYSISSGTTGSFSPNTLGLTNGSYTIYAIGAEQTFGALNTMSPNVFGVATASTSFTVNNCSGCVWTAGAGTSDWNTAGNWACGSVPTCTDNAIIPPGPTIMPIITGGSHECKDLTIQSGATSPALTISGGNLNICGNWINSATAAHFVHNNGTVSFVGSVSQAVSGLNTFANLSINNNAFGVTLNTATQIRALLLLQNGNLTSNGNLTLLSNATQTAMVLNNGAFTVVGNATVQRHITPYGSRPVGLGYTYFSNPTNGGTISSALSDDLGLVFNPAYKWNCWLYPAPLSSAPFPNVYLYNESLINTGTDAACMNESLDKFETGWQSAAAGTSFAQAKGFCVNIAGNTTVDVTGILNNGTINTPISKTAAATHSGWNLVGNPYPAPINWDLAYNMNAANLEAGTLRRMATGTYSGTWAYYLANVPTSGTNGATNEIAAMQGFFVRAINTANLQLDNTVRATSYTNTNFFKNENYFDLLKLALKNGNSIDETTIYFGGNTTNSFEATGDVWKSQLNSLPTPNVFTKIEDKNYAINGLGELTTEQIVPLHFIAAQAGKHSFQVNHLEGFEGVTVYLEDKALHILHEITKSAYNFTAEKGQNNTRFQIRFEVSKERAKDISVTLYPNPATANVKLQLSKAIEANISVVDMLGRKVMETSSQSHEVNLDIKALPQGIYVVEILTSEGMKSIKFVKE